VIQVEHVYKRYQLATTINFRTLFKDMFRAAQARQQRVRSVAERYVLEDINFALEPGESLGLIGHNGSGKSTLLRLLAGVSLPTRGRIHIEGRLAPLLSLGAGFHPELTGRENLYLNCTLLGLSFAQVRDRIDSIIDFSELHEYVDVPIKRYSSGMLARLGFAAAVHLDADVILIDEVLAVGDYSFYVKSTNAIVDFLSHGTVILVSHDLTSIEKLCQRTIWLHNGQLMADGASNEVINQYKNFQPETAAPSAEAAPSAVPISPADVSA